MTARANNSAAARLALQNDVSSLLASGTTLVEVADALLQLIVTFLDWDLGAIWLRERGKEGPLRAFRIHSVDPSGTEKFRAATAEASFDDGQGMPGEALQIRNVVLIPNVQTDPGYTRAHAARSEGMITGLAIPVMVRDEAIGTIEIYSRSQETIEDELLATLRSIGRQLGQFLIKLRLEGALAASEGGHRAVLESVAVGIVTIDDESRIVGTNPAIEAMFGYQPDELLGCPLTDLMPEPMRPLHNRGIRRYLETGEKHIPWNGIELPGRRRDGSEIIVSIAFSEFIQNNRTYFTGSLLDVTKRREAEREAEALRAQLDELVSTVPGVVWEMWGRPGDEDQRISFVSNQVEAMLGFSREEWLSSPNFWLDIVHPEDRERAARNARDTLEGRRHGPNTFRWLTRDGRTIWVEAHSVPIIRDGQPVGLRGVTLDVTDRIRSEQRIRILAKAGEILSRSLDYQQTLSQIADILVPDLADWCVIDLLNETGELERLRVRHVNPEKVALADLLERKYPTRPDNVRGAVRTARTGESELVKEIPEELIRQTAQNEEHMDLIFELGLRSYIVVPIVAERRIKGAMTLVSAESGYLYDEEDLHFAEEIGRRAGQAIANAELFQSAEAASRAKDEFLATLSHELRTPMTAILGWSRLLLLDDLTPDLTEEAIQTIATSAESQAGLIDDVLDVSRIVTGKLNLQLGPVDLTQVVRESISAVTPAARGRQIRIREDLAHVPMTAGDETRLRQVVWNLLSNAVKFTPKGGNVDVRLRVQESSIALEVEDDGIGIAPEFLSRAFERFQQGEGSTTRRHGGLGLGLAIVRHLTELHGGEVSVQSSGHGKGSLFRVVLPISALHFDQDLDESDFATDHPHLPQRLPQLPDISVLVVDDEPDALRLVSTILTQCGTRTMTASSVDAALALVRDRTPDMIVCDIGMPERDGYDLIHHIRASADERLRGLPMIALTAYGHEVDRQRVMKAGFDSYLRKPVHPIDLASAVASLLEISGSRSSG